MCHTDVCHRSMYFNGRQRTLKLTPLSLQRFREPSFMHMYLVSVPFPLISVSVPLCRGSGNITQKNRGVSLRCWDWLIVPQGRASYSSEGKGWWLTQSCSHETCGQTREKSTELQRRGSVWDLRTRHQDPFCLYQADMAFYEAKSSCSCRLVIWIQNITVKRFKDISILLCKYLATLCWWLI